MKWIENKFLHRQAGIGYKSEAFLCNSLIKRKQILCVYVFKL